MKRLLMPLLALALFGCANHSSYRYVDRVGAGGDYYYDRGYADTWYGYPYDVSYAYYPYYYSLFWGFRPYYYDPFFSPGFHYGVTWFPRTWFSFSAGYHDWGYYHAYSPWRHSFWDGYYTWYQVPRRSRPGIFHGTHSARFGSARNEAERLANLNAQTRRGLRTAGPADKSGDFILGARGRTPQHAGAVRGVGRTGSGAVTVGGRPAASRAPAGASSRGGLEPRSAPARSQSQARTRVGSPPPRPEARLEPLRSRGSWSAEPRYGGAEVWRPAASRPAPRMDASGERYRRATDTRIGAHGGTAEVPAVHGRRPLMLDGGSRGSPDTAQPMLPRPLPQSRFDRPAPVPAAPEAGWSSGRVPPPAPAPSHAAPPPPAYTDQRPFNAPPAPRPEAGARAGAPRGRTQRDQH
jgi:hypothetical protein